MLVTPCGMSALVVKAGAFYFGGSHVASIAWARGNVQAFLGLQWGQIHWHLKIGLDYFDKWIGNFHLAR